MRAGPGQAEPVVNTVRVHINVRCRAHLEGSGNSVLVRVSKLAHYRAEIARACVCHACFVYDSGVTRVFLRLPRVPRLVALLVKSQFSSCSGLIGCSRSLGPDNRDIIYYT